MRTKSLGVGETTTAWANAVVDTDDLGWVIMDVTIVCVGY